MRLPQLRRVRHLALYLSTRSELDTAPLIARLHRAGKTLWVPRVDGPRMRLVRLRARARLRPGPFRIPVPREAPRTPPRRIDLLVLPLLGFDVRGTRLGSGAGYYDRWLARARPRPLCLGYAYAMQQLDELPAESWDQRLHLICTERGLRRIPRFPEHAE